MTTSDAATLKKLLKSLGFEVYRTTQGRVLLAERIRDNLIMDSGVAVGQEGEAPEEERTLSVTVTVRTQASHFPGSSEATLKKEVSSLAEPFLERGYEELDSGEQRMLDPSDPSQVLDTSHELRLGRRVKESELQAELTSLLNTRRSSSD